MLHGYWLRTSASAAHRMCSSYANWRRPKSWYYEVSVVSPLTPASVDSIRGKKTQMLGVLHFVFTVYNLTPFVFQRSAFRSFRFSPPVVYLSLIVVSSLFLSSVTLFVELALSSSGSSNRNYLTLCSDPFSPAFLNYKRQYKHASPTR